MEASQLWSSLPAVIQEYDSTTCKATVKCLIKMRYRDGSQLPFPSIENVPIITPATAFSGIKLPVRVGDKVVLHIQDRDIQRLLFTVDTSGLTPPEGDPYTFTDTARLHDLTDCVAYTGFGSFDGTIPSDYDVWIFNNREDDENADKYNHIRLKQNGDIEIKTLKATGTLENGGDIELKNTTCSLTMQEIGNIRANNLVASTNMDPAGNILTTNGSCTTLMDVSGNVTVTAPTTVNMVTPLVNVTGNLSVLGNITAGLNVYADSGKVSLLTHKHSQTGNSPVNPS